MAEELAYSKGRLAPEERRYFTPDQADRAIPLIRRVVDDLVEVFHQVMELRGLGAADPDHDDPQQTSAYDAGMQRLSELLEELQSVGVELRDFELGVVGFPSMHKGREILLIWQRGDHAVQTWQEIEDGLESRKPLDSLGDDQPPQPPIPD
ncbi:MAG: DUF2203 domain-containing protein [Phycisphaeraceae bacterium]|nr:DUF2203 domain-containing protein [Phycisphaeraceae bacterium]